MSALGRRQFLKASVSAVALGAAGMLDAPARAAMGPNDKYDLLIKGGSVLDPSQNLRGTRDVGIRFGIVEAVEASIPPTSIPTARRSASRPTS
jgi:dihydroorotase